MSWQADKRWSDKYLTQIKRILGEYLISEPPIEEDAQRNTDLMVLRLDAVRVGCRVRKDEDCKGYYGEFTIRTKRPNGTKTELAKIIEGWGDYFFYGFGAENGNLTRWTLADMNVFRIWHSRYLATHCGKTPGMLKSNHDGSSSFTIFRWDDLPPEFVVASSTQAQHHAPPNPISNLNHPQPYRTA